MNELILIKQGARVLLSGRRPKCKLARMMRAWAVQWLPLANFYYNPNYIFWQLANFFLIFNS